MADKYIGFREEVTYMTPVGSDSDIFLKLLSESLNTTREDFYPETTQYWTPGKRAEGLFRMSGSFDTFVDPVVWPELLVLFLGDATTGGINGDGQYTHTFPYFGDQETTYGSGVKPATFYVGTGIEKDRELQGCVVESIQVEAAARDVVTCTVGLMGSGKEELVTADTGVWSAYTEPYLTFSSAQTMTVGGTDRLTTNPTIEAFRINMTRGWDSDHYVLGNRFVDEATLSGMASCTGSMDFSFTSQDEHERFLSAVGTFVAGDQASFVVNLILRGALIAGTSYNEVEFTLPKVHYSASTASVNARNRIVQTVEFIAMHDGTNGAALVEVRNETATYV